MSARRAAAVARRIVLQFRRDRRTLALLFIAPMVVLALVGAIWGSPASHRTRVIVAGDVPAPLVDGLRQTDLDVRTLGRDEAIEELRQGHTDAVVSIEGREAVILVEGSDPTVTGATVGGLQAALTKAVIGAGPSGLIRIDYLAPVFIALFAFFFIFLLATVSFLRERTSGTLERLLASPLRRGELVLGYLLGFGVFALLQALVILAFTIFVLKVQYRGNLATIFLVEAVLVVGSVSLGLAVSAFARNELQAVQFVPLVLLPQVFLSGLLVPLEQLPEILRPLARVLPLTYANEALRSVMVRGYAVSDPLIVRDLAILAAFALLAAAAAMASIRREVA